MTKRLKDLKVGDTIFVVRQQTRSCKEWRTSTETVSKVGRKYAYWKSGHAEYPFHKDTGVSAHKELNERANGYGFDVYTCEEEWRAELHAQSEFKRLGDRLCDRWGRLKPLPHEVVKLIHDMLDRWLPFEEKGE